MKILSEIISLIKISITSDEMESGGLLGMNSGIVCRFLFDKGTGSANEYVPNVSLFNQVLKEWAKENGVKMATVRQRLGKGHSVEVAISQKKLNYKPD